MSALRGAVISKTLVCSKSAERFYEPSEPGSLGRQRVQLRGPLDRSPVGRCAMLGLRARPPPDPSSVPLTVLNCRNSDISILRRQIFDTGLCQWQTCSPMTDHFPKRRGFPVGNPRNRLSPQQRQAIIDMLKITPNGAAVTRQFIAAKLGTVTHPTVCTIKREAIKRGEIRQARKPGTAAAPKPPR